MWRSISLRWQLFLILGLFLSLIEASALALAYGFDIKERKSLALEQAETLGRALQHDLLRALIEPQADLYSDISFRLNGFESLAALSLADINGKLVYRHEREGLPRALELLEHESAIPRFSDRYLVIRIPIVADDAHFGDVVQVLDLKNYKTKLREHLFTLLTVFPVVLLLSLVVAGWIARSYSLPFVELAHAMSAADVRNNRYVSVVTAAKNEIGTLYDGYNGLIEKIMNVTTELKYRGEHDSLTGLYNRFAIEAKIKNCLQGYCAGERHALIALDIDQFKLVNDAAGHVAGDDMLKYIAQIIKTCAQSNAMVARVGGDDFQILLENIDENNAMAQAQKIAQAVRSFRFTAGGQVFSVSSCIGLVVFRPHEYAMEALQIAVDTAFYAAKGKGRDQIFLFHSKDAHARQFSEDVQVAGKIKDALREGSNRFVLFAQRIVALQREESEYNYEILLRLQEEDGKLILPGQFLPTAARYDLISDIDTLVLRTFIKTIIDQPRHITGLGFVNVNIGGSTLNNMNFQKSLREMLRQFIFPWNKLVLEITETLAVGNLVRASDFIQECRQRGIRVALDDFGTGMASFDYLKNLPIDVVKIDGVFIREMLSNPIDHVMIRHVQEISKLRGQTTVAEFIENADQLAALKAIGIDYGQGYYLGKPIPLSDWLAGEGN